YQAPPSAPTYHSAPTAPPPPYEPYSAPAGAMAPGHDAEAWAGADTEGWPTVGDPATDSLMLEIEGGWVRTRGQVYEAIERAIRASVSDALRGALQTRMRIEQEARASLSRLAGERSRLID